MAQQALTRPAVIVLTASSMSYNRIVINWFERLFGGDNDPCRQYRGVDQSRAAPGAGGRRGADSHHQLGQAGRLADTARGGHEVTGGDWPRYARLPGPGEAEARRIVPRTGTRRPPILTTRRSEGGWCVPVPAVAAEAIVPLPFAVHVRSPN